jgi:hypothetical protein
MNTTVTVTVTVSEGEGRGTRSMIYYTYLQIKINDPPKNEIWEWCVTFQNRVP